MRCHAPSKRINFPQAVPHSVGIPADVVENVLVAPFNDPVYIQSLLAEFGNDVAAIILEPLHALSHRRQASLSCYVRNAIAMAFC